MQLLNSKILSNDKNTRYSNKKAQDTRVTCVFLSVVAFSYYKDGGDAGICLTAIVTEGQSRAAEGIHVAKQRHGFCRAKSPLRIKKRTAFAVPFFGGDAGFVANIVCVITEQRRTQCFLNRIVASDNAHSFACVLLFPTGTQYPAGSPEYRISDRLRSTICCKQQCYAFVRQIAQSLAMSAALDFRKCKRLLLSSLAVSPGTGVHTATPCCDFSKSQ